MATLPKLSDKSVTGAIGKGAQNIAAGVLAAAQLPFSYGGMLLRNQVNASTASINPLNYLQGITNILTPASGEFTRLYNKAGGGRQAGPMSPIGGEGSVDITPLVEQMDALLQLTDQRTTAMITAQNKTSGLITAQTQVLKALEAPKQQNAPQLQDFTPVVALLEDLRDSSVKLEDRTRNIQEITLQNVFTSVKEIERHERQSKAWLHRIIELMEGSGNQIGTSFRPFERVENAREDAEMLGDGTNKPLAQRNPDEKKGNILGQLFSLIGVGVMGWLARLGSGITGVMGVVGRLLSFIGGGALVTMFVRGFTGLFNGLGAMISGAFNGLRGLLGLGRGGANAAAGAASGAARTAASRTAGQTVARGALTAAGRRALGLIPVVGSAIYGMDAYNDFREGNIVGGAMNTAAAAVNLIPGAGWVAGLGLNLAAGALTDSNTDERMFGAGTVTGPQQQPANVIEAPRRNETMSKMMRAAAPEQQRTGNNTAPVTVVNNYNTTNNNGNGQGRISVNTGKSLADRSKDEWFRYVN